MITVDISPHSPLHLSDSAEATDSFCREGILRSDLLRGYSGRGLAGPPFTKPKRDEKKVSFRSDLIDRRRVAGDSLAIFVALSTN